MNPRDLCPPARLVSPVTVPVSAITTAGSQQGPAVTHSQVYGGQPHLGIPPANLIQQQGQTTAQPTSQQQQQYLMDGQNQRLTQNQNEANILFQQKNFNPPLINFSRPAFAHAQNYVGQANWGFPQENFIQQQGQITANPTSRQQWQQQQYLMGGQNGLLRPNQVNIPFQQQGLNQQMTITSSPALMYHQNYDAQAPWGFHTENAIQPQGQTTPQPFLQQQQQQHQQQLINEQKERLTPHKNEAFMTSKQPHLNQQMTYTSIPAIFYPENHEAQASWSIYPFIQQQGHTTPQPAQQQHQQQHLMSGQNERLSPYRNDAYMPSQLPTFNQYMATPSSKGWDSLDYKTRQHLPPLIKLDGSMENMSAPPAGPMRNMSASHAGSMGNMSASPAGPMGNMSNSPAGTIGNMSASPAGPMGNMSASPAYTMGNMSASPAGHMGSMSASPAGSMGNMSASPAGPMRNMSASPAGSMGNMSASPACTMGNMSASPADPMGNMSDSPVGIIGNMSASPAGPMGNMSASPAGPMGNMSASPSGPMRNMFNSPVDPKGNMSASHAGSIGNLSASPNDSIGNDHRIFHDLNQRPCSQPLDPIDDRFSQFPMIIAEKRNYDDSIGEIGNSILAKRPKTDAYTDPLGTSVNYKDLSGDEDRRLDSGNNKGDDPLSDLTKDQRIVLYTLFLCQDYIGKICIDGDDCIGDIDVGEIIKELRNKGLVEPRIPGDRVYISFEKRPHIMKSYRENCLLSEIDKDFFIQVASNGSIGKYAEEYCRHVDGSRKSEDIGPITMMRLIVEGRGNELPSSVKDEVPAFLIDDEKELGKFVKFWCKARNADPVTLSDQIPDEKIKKFYSAFTILSGLKNELMEMHFSKKKWSILISILMSESYSVCVNMPWEEKRKEIQQTFISLQDVKEERADEDLVLLKELEHCDILLTVDRENKYLYFVSEEVRHQVMGYFVLNCLESKEDYENFLNLSSVDSLFEYARPLRYKRNVTERCMYLPKGTEELLIRRLGIDAILHASIGNNDIAEEISSKLKLPPPVLRMTPETKNKFCNFVKGFNKEHAHHGLNLCSLFGSFLINLKMPKKKDLFNLSLPSSKMGILCTILLSNGYKLCLKEQWKDSIKETRQTFKALQSNEAVEDELLIKELVNNDNMLMKDDVLNNVHFAKDDVRHQVMSYFVRTCLDTDEDYINYIDLSSVDSLLEYVRTWRFGNVEEERCLHLPERMEDKYIKKLDVHILCHVNMKEFRCGITELANNCFVKYDCKKKLLIKLHHQVTWESCEICKLTPRSVARLFPDRAEEVFIGSDCYFILDIRTMSDLQKLSDEFRLSDLNKSGDVSVYEETDVHVLGPHKNPENSPTEKQPSCLGEFSCNKAAKLLRKIFHRPTRFVEGLVEKLLSPNKKYYSKL